MWDSLPDALKAVTARLFVLWDTDGCRGWLVHGDIVALHLLRAYLQTIDEPRVDFYSLNGVTGDSISAYEVLKNIENLERVYWPPLKDVEEKPESSNNGKSAEGEEKVIKDRVIAEAMSGIYATLIEMSDATGPLNARNGLAAPVAKWVEKKWSTTVKGWDFYDIPNRQVARVYVHKLRKNPGWLNMARDLDATFLFANGIGEILEPRDGSCCPYFRTLPKGHNFLASSMEDLTRIVTKYGGQRDDNETVARLGRDQVWERRLHPFQRPGCQGDHLDQLEPSCFPVQGVLDEPITYVIEKREEKDLKLLQGKNVYTKGQILEMGKKNKDGVVVFGRQPEARELRDIYRRRQQKIKSGTQQRESAAPATAQPSNRPLSRGSVQGSTGPPPAAGSTVTTQSRPNSLRSNTSASDVKGARNPAKASGKASAASIGRASSITSVRSIASSTNRDPGAGSAAERAQTPTPQARPASTQRTPSISSVRSTASKLHPRAPSTATDARQPGTSSSQPLADSARKTASIASLRSTGSDTRPRATAPSSGRLGESTAEPNAPTAARKPSNSSMRTTSSVDSRATGGSNLQTPAAQPPTPTLKKSTTDSSDRTTSSRTSRSTQSSAAGSTLANSLQRQQRLGQLSAATAATAMTDGHHSTSSGPAPTAGGGQEG